MTLGLHVHNICALYFPFGIELHQHVRLSLLKTSKNIHKIDHTLSANMLIYISYANERCKC